MKNTINILIINKKTMENIEQFKELSKPLIKWLNDNGHPHMKIIIDCISSEIVEGQHNYICKEFIDCESSVKLTKEDEEALEKSGLKFINEKRIQIASYIEDGAYIEIIGNEFVVYEIPQYGGQEHEIGGYKTLTEAINVLNSLT